MREADRGIDNKGHTSARFLEDEYSISYTTILRIDKEVLENDIPKPKMQNVQGVLIDEKFLGASQGFVTVCLDATTGEPLEMVKVKVRCDPGTAGTAAQVFLSLFHHTH